MRKNYGKKSGLNCQANRTAVITEANYCSACGRSLFVLLLILIKLSAMLPIKNNREVEKA
jgi:hypothetical protein